MLCALIGVFGTVVGTIIGALLPTIQNGIGRKSVHFSNVEVHWGSGICDECGYTDSSHLNFTLSILNKKGKDLILEQMRCTLYSSNHPFETFSCFDRDSLQYIAARAVYEELVYIDVPAHSSRTISVHIGSSKDLRMCDKAVFTYSWGIQKRELVVWVKQSNLLN